MAMEDMIEDRGLEQALAARRAEAVVPAGATEPRSQVDDRPATSIQGEDV
jgi:hypothetical protein